ncbi:AGAP009805-PL-like protein [Anopheles sinensis]|uniref:Gustatory receptor n=1 Tax=Anopheles sinensis TaxID=74873 RepID=A0A084WG55_ANOSI|nr:AGAP009805-PL-like protein [Anopheles sinensis]
MSPMVTRYRLLLLLAAGLFLIPCRYNRRNESFEISRWNLAAFPLTFLGFGATIWLNVTAVGASVNLLPAVYLAALTILLAVGSLLMISVSLNTFYHRATFVRLLNTLLAQEETTLECLAMRRNGGKQIPVTHDGNLWILIVTAILYIFYTLTFVGPDMIMCLMNGAIWLRYSGMFLLVEVFRACLRTIDVRMKQLKALVMPIEQSTNAPEQQIETNVLIFVEKYQLYYEQIDLINRCFSVPLLLIILLILMDRTVAVYDLYMNLEHLTHMTATEVCALSWRQMVEMIYLGLLIQIAITCESTTVQQRSTDKYCLVVESRTICLTFRAHIGVVKVEDTRKNVGLHPPPSTLVASPISHLLSTLQLRPHERPFHANPLKLRTRNRRASGILWLFLSRFFPQNHFLAGLDSFMLGIVIIELLTMALVPLCTVLNSCVHRSQVQKLLNVLFADDWMLDSCGTSTQLTRSANVYKWYIRILWVAATINGCFKCLLVEGIVYKLFPVFMTVRYLYMLSYLYLYHLCVTMIVVRMTQLRAMFYQHYRQDPSISARYIGHFVERFERYTVLIEQINSCLSPPLLVMYLMCLSELTFFIFECFLLLTVGRPDTKYYGDIGEWLFSQFWQAIYGSILLLTIPCCERAKNEYE